MLADAPATCSMLPEIREAVGDKIKIFVDGGIRSGLDVFKAIPNSKVVPFENCTHMLVLENVAKATGVLAEAAEVM